MDFAETPRQSFFIALKQGDHDARDFLQAYEQDAAFIVNAMIIKEEGTTAIHYATSKGYNLLVDFVLARAGFWSSFLLNFRDDGGNTPLMSAVLSSKTSTAELLLEYGADSTICNIFNETPLWKAIELQDYRMVRLLAEVTNDFQWSERYLSNKSVLRWAVENLHSQPRRLMCEQFEELFRECQNSSQVIEGMHKQFSEVEMTRDDGREILILVLQRYLSLGDVDNEYMGCIGLACANGDMDTLEAMLKAETPLDQQVEY
ncbi:unnamed protein product [Penicillium salamii]|uniref:Uncharacterized protein n=1 Tax=Penicillium salamii TaxID=1612424 RepID=A0A9W4K1M8_9EURO|nr:unnamed protein product [Penicillium salamii]CAG7946644.1 unnamed protein product [Penicillium salamii]CAG8240128.1 unnamed protein product [Penicillium salamii]CAG8344245.1 unnamed protein product [Penicillium salamii]CAG8383441.1 unnamed protein product [Penicillium salamii]